MEKRNITDLRQAEDRNLPFAVTINGQAVVDVAKILFVIKTDDEATEVAKYEMGDFASFAGGIITIRLTDAITTDMVGRYKYELWFQDSQAKDVPVAYGILNFKSTFARY